jgi:hypothetical protein
VNSERSRDERAQRRERGLPNGGTRPFGWEKDGIAEHPVEMPALRKGVRDALAGVAIKAISRDWSEAKGATVGTSTVRRVLLSERLRGRLADGKPAVWDAVVTDDEAAALRGILTARQRGTNLPTQLQTGLAGCGVCGSTVRGAVNRLGVGCYECSAHPHLRVPREPRDAFVIDLVADYLDREGVQATADTEPLSTRHAALTERLGEIADAFADGEMTREQSRRATDRLRTQLAEVEAALAAMTRTTSLPTSGAQFRAMTRERQRAVLEVLQFRVIFDAPGRGKRYFDPTTIRTEARTSAA